MTELSALQFHLRMVSQRGPNTNGLLKLIKILIDVVNEFGLKSLNLEFILSTTNVGCTTWHRPISNTIPPENGQPKRTTHKWPLEINQNSDCCCERIWLKSLNLEFILSTTNVGCTTWHRPISNTIPPENGQPKRTTHKWPLETNQNSDCCCERIWTQEFKS